MQMEILGKISHPNLVNIVDLIKDNQNFYIVFEYLKGGDL